MCHTTKRGGVLPEGYIDLQVNGYGGVDFNQNELTAHALNGACRKLRADGVGGVLATIITDEVGVMLDRLRRLYALREADDFVRDVIIGFHIEGPFISGLPGYVGAHPVEAVRPAEVDTMHKFLDVGGGLVRLVTLAPECDQGQRTTRMLADQGVAVSAGHTDASLDQLKAAIDAGLSMFTHLGNGCPSLLPRHDNIIQRVLSLRDRLMICFIADGVHIPFFALKGYLETVGPDRAIVVSDAMPAAGLGPGRYTLGRWDLHVGDDLAVRSPDASRLIGSAMSMRQAEKNLREHIGLHEADVVRLLDTNPRTLLA